MRLRHLVLVLAFLAGGASAQPPAPADDPEAVVDQSLVVVARLTGPAWWRVSKGDAEVWVMGLPAGPIPKGMVFDRARLREHLKGASLYMPPPGATLGIKTGLFEGMGLLAHMAPGMGWTNGDVEKAMPPELAERFRADRERLGQPVSRYASPVPALAVFKLNQDYLSKAGLVGAFVPDLIEEARHAGAPIAKPVTVSGLSFTLKDLDLARPPITECFKAVLEQIETDPALYVAAARGWSEGALRVALGSPREPFSVCENRLYSGTFVHRMIAAETDAIAARLTSPGRTVAVMGLRTLLARDGVVSQLRARGFTVDGPDVVDEPRRGQ